jgi:energy-coupling factor transporter ATP-binding protein EcfA2
VALSWVVPAAKAIYDHREDILTGWDFVKRWLGSGKHLVFTGMPGSGKTVLLDYLSGAAFAPETCCPIRPIQWNERKLHAAAGG